MLLLLLLRMPRTYEADGSRPGPMSLCSTSESSRVPTDRDGAVDTDAAEEEAALVGSAAEMLKKTVSSFAFVAPVTRSIITNRGETVRSLFVITTHLRVVLSQYFPSVEACPTSVHL